MLAPELEKRLQEEYPGLLGALSPITAADIADIFPTAAAWLRELDVGDKGPDIMMEAAMCSLWRRNRIIYHLDEALGVELSAQAQRMELGDKLPGELLTNLPYPCISVEGPPIQLCYRTDQGETVLDYTGRMMITVSKWVAINQTCMTVMLEAVDGKLPVYYMPIVGTVGDCVDALRQSLLNDFPGLPVERVMLDAHIPIYAAQIILYLQAVNADIERKPSAPTKKGRTKSGYRPPKPPREYNIGYHVGQVLRRARRSESSGTGTGTGTPRRPHSRRGHWHNYWVGSERDNTRRLELKWVAPMVIHGDRKDELPTVYKIKRGEK